MYNIAEALKEEFGAENISETNESTVTVEAEMILQVIGFLHRDKRFYFDYLSNITGIDEPETNSLRVVYNLYSIPFNIHCTINVELEKPGPKELTKAVPSLCELFRTANWLEREVYDMYGIPFENHPDLRRILMPADWEGFPLRKDYIDPERYHGVKIEYEEEN